MTQNELMATVLETASEKPKEGEPCNGCGACCAAERCDLAVIAIGDGPGPCPLLVFSEKDKRFWCSLVLTEEAYQMEPIVRKALGVGKGCYASDGEER